MTESTMEEPLLAVEDLRTYFDTDAGTAQAVDGVSFSIPAGKTLAVSIAGSGDVVYSGDAQVKSSVAGSGSSAQKQLPPPALSCTPTSPPMRAASSRQIDSPSPVPP